MAGIPKQRIGQFTGWIFIGFALLIDGLQVILNFFAIGLAANRYIDIGVAFVFLFILGGVFKVSYHQHPLLYFSIAAVFVLEEIPLVDVAPLWFLDARAIVKAVRADDAARINAALSAEAEHEETIRKQQQRAQLINRIRSEAGEKPETPQETEE